LAILAVVLLAVLVFLPMFARPHIGQRISCTNNLKQIGVAFMTWALDYTNLPMRVSITNGGTMELNNGLVFPHFLVMSNELSVPVVLICPDDTKRMAQIKNRRPTLGWGALINGLCVSYFVNVDADQTKPQAVLAGDDHLLVNGQGLTPGVRILLPTDKLRWSKSRHDGGGNLLLLDGSVQQVTPSALASVLQPALVTSNRLAFP
jgi:prepilin-type processing-associated H-X9-DG protein